MGTREVPRIFLVILQLCSYGIAFIGYKRLRKAVKELEEQKKEKIVIEEFSKVILTGRKLILTGIIAGTIFGIITTLLQHDI